MKKITLLLFALFTCWQINAQVSSYAFSQSNGTYTPITGGTVVLSGTSLDVNNAAVTLPVAFPFNGSNITSVNVRTDGYLVLGTATTGSTAPISSTMTATGIVSAFGCDLMDANAVGTIPEVRWEQVGDEIIFQWNDFARYTGSTSVEIFDFQIRLNTINGIINIVYNDFSSTSTSTTYTPQVGLRGSTNSDFNSRRLTTTVPDATPSWDDTIAATSNAHTVRFTSNSPAAFPSSGLTFTWTPPLPCSGTPVAGTVTPALQNICSGTTPANVVATGFSSGVTGLTFQWEESNDDGVTDAWAPVVGGTGATTATFTPPAFSGTPIYYRLNVTCTNSTTSAQTASVLVTTPLAPTTQTSAITIPTATVNYNRAVINWTNGNGPRRVVYISDSPTFSDPVDGNAAALVANTVYAGSGQQIIFDGTGTSVTVTGLAIGTQYYVKAYEYLRCGSGPYDYYYNVTTGTNIGTFTTCGAYTVPASEDFTTYVPGCWLEADNGDLVAGPATFGSSSWAEDGFAQVGTTGAFNYNIYTTGANDWVLSPLYSIPATGWELKFDAAANQFGSTGAPTTAWEADDFVQVLVSTGTTNWTVLYTYNNTNVPSNIGTPNIIDLDAYAGQTVRFAFRAVEGTSNGSADIDFSIDNFELRESPSCVEPTGLVVSNVATTGATISWNAVDPAPSTGYEYYYSNVNTAPSGAGTAINALTDNLSGLTPNTTYYVWLRSDCGSGAFSPWVGPVSFYTGYCLPSSTSGGSYVDNFTTSGGSLNISNLTSGFTTGGYLDATSLAVESYENGSFDFNATIQGPTVGFAIWIDWNNNLVFEASEKVYNTTSYGSGPFSGTITVPSGTALGNYRMRITTDWNASNPSDPCAARSRAEFEDYTVTVSNPPACLVPNTIIASNITSSTVDLSWTDGSGGLQFDYEYVIQAPGTGEPTGAGAQIGDVTVVGEGFDINGNPLTPNTLYEVYVRSDCGGSFSSWAGPITFRTLCESFTVPFSEGFNSTSTTEACWTKLNVNADGDSWDTNYTLNPFEGDQVAVIYTDFNGGANDDWLISPTITLTGNQRLKFHYRVQSSTEPNDFELLLSTSGIAPASFTNTLIANTSYSNTTYVEQVVDISAYSGDVNIAWHVANGGLDGWRLYIDNVIVEDIPSCVEPNTIIASNVTSSTVDLSWTDGSGGAQFDYEYAIQAPGTGIPATAGAQVGDVTVVGEGFDINGNPLAANTTYEVYVRADCGGGDFSPWIGPITFTTLCNTYVAPYTEDFENAGTIPSCWNMSGSENWLFSNTPGFNHIGNNGVITGSTTSGGYFAWVDDSSPNTTNATLTSPLIDVSGLTVPRLTFFELSNNEGANPNSTLNVEVWDGAAWNAMATYNTNTNGWEKRVIDLSTLTITGDIQVRFIIVESSSFYDDIAIDDVTIEETPSCIEPTMFTVDTVGTDTVTVSWTAGAGETEWEYVVQAQGTGVPAGAGVSTTSNPLVISGLTPNTPYEIYLRAVCSVTEQSIWVGPFNVETNIEVVCGTPVNTTYCYTDNDTTSWTFTSSDGSPLRVVFNAGQVENTWDELIVIDSDGVTQLYNGYGAAGNLAGLTFDATGDTITVMISSDGSANCGDSGYTSWDFDVVCATCVNPTVTFNIVPDCANSQYSIEVDVTNIGSATSLTISDGTTDLTGISATGVQTFGPYADGSSNTVVVTNEQDGACFVTSGALSYSCPPSNDDCVNAIAVDCGDVVTGTTTTATNSSGGTSADVWYSYSGAAGDITVSLCNNTNYDSYLRVYDACGGTEIAFNDDFCNAQSSVTFTADGTTTYYILVEGFGSNVGNFEMAVTCVLSNGDFNSNSFSAYPNPVKDVLNISYATEISSVKVINMIGQEVLSKNVNATSSQVDMSQLSAGTYIVNVTLGDTIKTLKVVKQ